MSKSIAASKEFTFSEFVNDILTMMRSNIQEIERQTVNELVAHMSPEDMHSVLTNYLPFKTVIKAVERKYYNERDIT